MSESIVGYDAWKLLSPPDQEELECICGHGEFEHTVAFSLKESILHHCSIAACNCPDFTKKLWNGEEIDV